VVLGDDTLIDAHHQAWEDYRDARTEGGDIVDIVVWRGGEPILLERLEPESTPKPG